MSASLFLSYRSYWPCFHMTTASNPQVCLALTLTLTHYHVDVESADVVFESSMATSGTICTRVSGSKIRATSWNAVPHHTVTKPFPISDIVARQQDRSVGLSIFAFANAINPLVALYIFLPKRRFLQQKGVQFLPRSTTATCCLS
jgi:hypothetical protein